jgi:hypothetical protein
MKMYHSAMKSKEAQARTSRSIRIVTGGTLIPAIVGMAAPEQQRYLHITCPQYRNLTERYKHVLFSKVPTKLSVVFRAFTIRKTQARDRQIALIRRLFWIVLKFKVRVLEAN